MPEKLFWDKCGTVVVKGSGYGVMKIPKPEKNFQGSTTLATTDVEVHNKSLRWVAYRLSFSHGSDFELRPCPGGVLGPNERHCLEVILQPKYDDVKNCYHLYLEASALNPDKKRLPNLDYVDAFEYRNNADMTRKRFPITIYQHYWGNGRKKFLITFESCTKTATNSTTTVARLRRLCQRMKHDGSVKDGFLILLALFSAGVTFGYVSRKFR